MSTDLTPIDIIETEHNNIVKFIKLLDDSWASSCNIKPSVIYAWYKFVTAAGCEVSATKEELKCEYKNDDCVIQFTLSWNNRVIFELCRAGMYKMKCSPLTDCDYNFEALVNRFIKVSNMIANNPDISFTTVTFKVHDLKMTVV